ncbi:MAG: FtsH protease activity modulator HflK [Magnetococcales bacterium]|nr:FtsH protease activity modulator HflK [Magnetococcales bacterium]
MSWNNDGGKPGGPWGSGPRGPQPPDVEEMIRMARERLSGHLPGGGKVWPILLGTAFVIWMATGIYLVGPDEQGVVVRFGEYVQTTESGPHYHLPYPIEQVYKPKVTQVQRIEIGFRTRNRTMVDVQVESLMLTGDENIIDIDLSVQYRLKDAKDYLFNVRSPSNDVHKVVRDAAESAIRQVIGRNSIDEALTAGKESIQEQTRLTMQEILDGYLSGIHVLAVQLQQVAPPEEVVQAFKDVASAREDRERTINVAHGYSNDILPKAKGEAARIVQEAEAYKTATEMRAKGDVQRFLNLRAEYQKAPEITRKRLYLETMEEIYSHSKKVLIDSGVGGVLPYLPLDGRTGHERPASGIKGEKP